MKSILIVGAGAAGMAAAITAARRGAKVTILEANEAVGRKIHVSGNGRCNIGNRHIEASRYHSHSPERIRQVLSGYGAERILEFLRSCGIEVEEEQEGKLFPMGRQAATVVTLLKRECQRLGVEIVSDCKVMDVTKRSGSFELRCEKALYRSPILLLAAGSPAAPQLGGSNTGMLFAQALGHRLIPPRPALVALTSPEPWKRAAGVKLRARVELKADGSPVTERTGDLLFTDYGVSGLTILDLSREASLHLAEWSYCELHIDLFPDWSKERLARFMSHRVDPMRDLPLDLWMEGIVHRKLVPLLLKRSTLPPLGESALDRKKISRLVHACKHLSLPLDGSRDFRYAEVATGGVDLDQVDPETMASRLIPGLYFAGEILDVDGDRGGFNFHWAWTTGMRVGNAVKK